MRLESETASSHVSRAVNLQPVAFRAGFSKRSYTTTVTEESNAHVPINFGISAASTFRSFQSSTEISDLSFNGTESRYPCLSCFCAIAIFVRQDDSLITGGTDFEFYAVGFVSTEWVLQEAI